jgi:hypothetical protein
MNSHFHFTPTRSSGAQGIALNCGRHFPVVFDIMAKEYPNPTPIPGKDHLTQALLRCVSVLMYV